jgi:hypothetical protein
MNCLDNIKVGDTVILVERWRVEEKYVRRVTTNLLWVENLKEAFSRKTGRDTSWSNPPEYPFIATNTDARMETAACDKRLAVRRIAREYKGGNTEHDVSIESIGKDCTHIDSQIYAMEQRIKGMNGILDKLKTDRLAHSERAVAAEAALRELGFTDDEA